MKVKIFALIAAFFMLMGGSAWAQADVKGDVNKDGVVNEQDIAAILAIMAKNNGVAEKTKYYWYVGQENPAEMTSISPIVTENGIPGWRLTGSTLSATYNYDTDAYPIVDNPPAFGDFYIALPQNTGLSFFNVLDADCIANGTIENTNKTVTMGNVVYNIYIFTDCVEFTGFKLKNK